MVKFIFFFFISHSLYATESLEKRFDEIRMTYGVPGLSALIYKDGEVPYHIASGIRKVGHQELIAKNDKFHLGSCGKAMTATLVAKLVEEGMIEWKDNLNKHFSEDEIDPQLKKITIEMLLSHSGGFPSHVDSKLMSELYGLDAKKGREALSKFYLKKGPEEKIGDFLYSNIGYIIVGNIIERKLGRSFEDLIREKIFVPLNMPSCGFGVTSDPQEKVPTAPWGHQFVDWKVSPIQEDNPKAFISAGGIHCSLNDWLKFLTLHMDAFNKKPKLLTQKSFTKLHTVSFNKDSFYTSGGWIRVERDWAQGDVLTHSGSNTLNYSRVWIAPKRNIILMGVANSGSKIVDQAVNEALTELLD